MDIHTAAKYMRHGYRIRRGWWHSSVYAYEEMELIWLRSDSGVNDCTFTIDDLLADDWELITEGIVAYFPVTYDK